MSPSSLAKSYPPITPNSSSELMSPNKFLNESSIGVNPSPPNGAPEVTAADIVSLNTLTNTNPGSRVTVSLNNPAGIASIFIKPSDLTPPIDCIAMYVSMSAIL